MNVTSVNENIQVSIKAQDNKSNDVKENKFNDVLKKQCATESNENKNCKVSKDEDVKDVKDVEIKEKAGVSLDDINKLLTLLSDFLNGKLDLNELKTQIAKLELPADLKSIVQNAITLKQNSISEDDLSQVTTKTQNNPSKNELVDIIKQSLIDYVNKDAKTALGKGNVNLVTKETPKITEQDKKDIPATIKVEDNATVVKSNDSTNSTKAETSSKDDDFLSTLIKDNSKSSADSSIGKVTNFMTQFNNIKNSEAKVEPAVTTINKNSFTEDIIKSIKFMQSNNMSELTVKIVPKELGEVVIKLTMDGNLMKANITAANKETYNLLNSSLNDINNNSNFQNIKIQDININVYQQDTTFFSGQSSQQDDSQDNGERTKKVGEISQLGDEQVEDNIYDNALNALA